MNFIKSKTGKITIGDALLIALTKSFEEKLLTPVIGNGTYLSGGVKLASAGLLKTMVGGKIGDIVGTALTVDGAEDIVYQILGNGNPFSSNSSSSSPATI